MTLPKGLAVAAIAIAVLYPLVSGSPATFLTIVFAKALPVLGIILLLHAGQVSFGHAMFFGAGAYATGFALRYLGQVDLFVLLPLAALASVLAGLIIGVFVVRYRYIFFAMLNLAFSMVLYSLLEKFFHVTGGSDGMRVARPTVFGQVVERAEFETILYYIALVLLCMALFFAHRLLNSPLGHALRAVKTNEVRIEYLGISARTVLLKAYVASALLAGTGGALVAIFQGLATPDYSYWVRSGEFVFVAILGGTGHVLGALVGSFAFEFVRNTAAAYMGDTWQLTLGVVLLGIIMFLPTGLIGTVDLISRFRGRRATTSAPVSGSAGRLKQVGESK